MITATIKQRSLPDSSPSPIRLTSLLRFVILSRFLDKERKREARRAARQTRIFQIVERLIKFWNARISNLKLETLRADEFSNDLNFHVSRFLEISGSLESLNVKLNFQTQICEISEFKIFKIYLKYSECSTLFEVYKFLNARFSELSKFDYPSFQISEYRNFQIFDAPNFQTFERSNFQLPNSLRFQILQIFNFRIFNSPKFSKFLSFRISIYLSL